VERHVVGGEPAAAIQSAIEATEIDIEILDLGRPVGRKRGFQPGDRPARSNGVAAGLHPDRERDPALLERLRGMQRRLGPEVRARQAALVRRDGYADLERIACPALVVACRQDRLRSFGETERMARHLPHARFEIIENCGHMAPLERPHELAALLADWVAEAGL